MLPVEKMNVSTSNSSSVQSNFTDEIGNNIVDKNSSITGSIYNTDVYIAIVNKRILLDIYLPSLIYTITLFLIGLPGNALVIYVYLKWRRSTSRLFIISLAVYDFVNCSFTMPTEIYFLVNIIRSQYPVLCKISRFTTFAMNNGSSMVLLAISVDRFFRIYKPLVPPMRKRTAEIIIICSIFFASSVSWPALFLFGEATADIPIRNKTIKAKMCLINDQYKTTSWPLVYNSIMTIGTVIIDLIMIIAYTYIGTQAIKAIRETQQFFPSFACSRSNSIDMSLDGSHAESINGDHNENVRLTFRSFDSNFSPKSSTRSQNTHNAIQNSIHDSKDFSRKASQCTVTSMNKRKKDRSLSGERGRRQMFKSTFMLFLVTLLFIVSYIPYCTIVYIRYSMPNVYTTYTNSGKATYQLFLRSYMLSSTLNPVIYSFLSDKFRNQCKLIFSDIFNKIKLLGR